MRYWCYRTQGSLLRASLPLLLCLSGFGAFAADHEGNSAAALSWASSGFKAAGTNVCTFVVGQVTDPIGDATPAGATPASPDLASGSVTLDSTGTNVTIRVRFAPGTFSRTNTIVAVALDTDQNPATGLQGINANAPTDVSLFGADYIAVMGSTFYGNTAQLYRYTGTAGLQFAPVAGAPVTYNSDGMDVTLPLTAFGATFNGLLNFKVLAYSLLTGPTTGSFGAFSAVADVMPNVGSAAGSTACPASGAGQPALQVFSGGVVNAASFSGGAVAPGELITIFGSGIGPTNLSGLTLTPSGNVSTQLSNTQVLFDNIPAPLIYTQNGQIAAVVPYEVAGKTSTNIQVIYNGQTAAIVPVSVTTASPALFTSNSTGTGQAAASNQDGTINSSNNPAARGTYVTLYGTGGGQYASGSVTGQVTPTTGTLPTYQTPLTVTVGGVPATTTYAGPAPGFVSGVFQINVLIPANAPTGNVPVVVSSGSIQSSSTVTIAVK